jgi:membrane-bound metal-dependent hydrolase YbcI (DUF457 family)
MTGRSHLVIGTASAVTAAAVTGATTATAAVVVAGAMATAKLPDVDLTLHIRHRGPTHTIIACILLAAATVVGLSIPADTAAYAWPAMAGVVIGYGMHLVADTCTPHGLAVFAPFSRRCVHLLPRALWIRTGSAAETVIVTMLAAGMGLLIYGVYA